jgi:hypothetical protein
MEADGVAVTLADESGNTCSAVMQDISRGGCSVVCEREFPQFSVITLAPPPTSGLSPVQMRVMRITALAEGSGMFEIGLQHVDSRAEHRHAWFLSLYKAA